MLPDPTAEENLTIASGRGLAQVMKAFTSRRCTEMRPRLVPASGNRIELRSGRRYKRDVRLNGRGVAHRTPIQSSDDCGLAVVSCSCG